MMQIGELVFYGGRVLLEMELVAGYVVMICQPRRVMGCRIQSDGGKGALRLRRVGAEQLKKTRSPETSGCELPQAVSFPRTSRYAHLSQHVTSFQDQQVDSFLNRRHMRGGRAVRLHSTDI